MRTAATIALVLLGLVAPGVVLGASVLVKRRLERATEEERERWG